MAPQENVFKMHTLLSGVKGLQLTAEVCNLFLNGSPTKYLHTHVWQDKANLANSSQLSNLSAGCTDNHCTNLLIFLLLKTFIVKCSGKIQSLQIHCLGIQICYKPIKRGKEILRIKFKL